MEATYHLMRIDLQDEEGKPLFVKEICSMIEKYTRLFVYCIEEGHAGVGKTPNEHLHLYIELTAKEDTFRKALNKAHIKGNRCYSMKSCEQYPIEGLAYLLKQGRYYNFEKLPDEIVEQVNKYQADVKEGYKKKKEARQSAYQTLMKEIDFTEVEENGIEEMNKLVQKKIVEYYVSRGLLLRKFQMQSLYDTIRYNYTSKRQMMSYFFGDPNPYMKPVMKKSLLKKGVRY